MSTALALVEAPELQKSIAELTETANTEHQSAEDAIGSALVHALLAGDALNEIHARLPFGQWTAWVAENFHGSLSNATIYRRLALHKDVIVPAQFASIRHAKTHLAKLGLMTISKSSQNDRASEMVRLRNRGMQVREIAELYGVSDSVVSMWTIQGSQEKMKERSRLNKQRSRAATAALRREQRAKLMRSKNDPISRAWENVRVALAELQKALDSESRDEPKYHLNEAFRGLHLAEDNLVSARKTSV